MSDGTVDGGATGDETRSVSRRQEAARARILRAGRELYFARGFGGVTTDMIAAAASVSKATIYKHFGSTSDLFETVVGAEVAQFGYDPEEAYRDLAGFENALVSYCTKLLQFLSNPDVLAFTSLMFAEARDHPDAAGLFFEAAYGQTLTQLAAMISVAQERGLIAGDRDARDGAEDLLAMLEGIAILRMHFGRALVPFPEPARRSAAVVRQFLKANSLD